MNENINMNIDDSENNTEIETKDNEKNYLSEDEKRAFLLKKVTISMNMLINFKILLEVATNRGAYKAGELSQVGGVYDEINNIVSLNSNMDSEE
jgi:hypothetical protein